MTDQMEHYSEESFWEKLRKHATKAGKIVVEKALTLYYCLLDKDTPVWAKGTIIAALGYFIFPVDLIPDFLPGGYADDLATLTGAFIAVAAHVKEEHKTKAKETLKNWFG